MDSYETRYPRRNAPPTAPNLLVEMAPTIITWGQLESYFKDTREAVLQELAEAETDRQMWQAQGKLALTLELLNLRAILATLEEAQGKE